MLIVMGSSMCRAKPRHERAAVLGAAPGGAGAVLLLLLLLVLLLLLALVLSARAHCHHRATPAGACGVCWLVMLVSHAG
jgi:hypothetical protein